MTMANGSQRLIVVGQGAAGLAAALSAVETAATAGQSIHVTLIDKAPENEAGGNTRWSPSYMRMAAPDRVEPSFVQDTLAATKFKGDERYFTQLARKAPETIKWIGSHGIEFIQPTYYLAKGPPRMRANPLDRLGGFARELCEVALVAFEFRCRQRVLNETWFNAIRRGHSHV